MKKITPLAALDKLDEVLNRVSYGAEEAHNKGQVLSDPEMGDTPALFNEDNNPATYLIDIGADMLYDNGESYEASAILRALSSAVELVDNENKSFSKFKAEYDKWAGEFTEQMFVGSDILSIQEQPKKEYISSLRYFFDRLLKTLEESD